MNPNSQPRSGLTPGQFTIAHMVSWLVLARGEFGVGREHEDGDAAGVGAGERVALRAAEQCAVRTLLRDYLPSATEALRPHYCSYLFCTIRPFNGSMT